MESFVYGLEQLVVSEIKDRINEIGLDVNEARWLMEKYACWRKILQAIDAEYGDKATDDDENITLSFSVTYDDTVHEVSVQSSFLTDEERQWLRRLVTRAANHVAKSCIELWSKVMHSTSDIYDTFSAAAATHDNGRDDQ